MVRLLPLLVLCISAVPLVSATSWYANSATGSDSNDCQSASTACKSLAMLCTFGWDAPGFAAGDTIYLSGTFSTFSKAGKIEPDYFWMQLDLSHGAPGSPIRITSLDPTNPAVIDVDDSHGINIYTWLVGAAGHVQIDHLTLVGNGGLDFQNNQTTSGIFIYHDAPGDISDFVIDSVDVSGFSEAGFFSFRYNESNATGIIRDIVITNSAFHHNPGYLGIQRPSGSGVVLSGVAGATVWNTTAYRNGEMNTNHGGGPVGIWTYDADRVNITNCTSFENLSMNNDGGGYDFDGGTTNSIIDNCISYSNYGPGYEACSFAPYGPTMNNNGWNQNNIISNSISLNDADGKKFASVGVFPFEEPITNLTISNVTITIDEYNCTTWGQTYTTHNGVWIDPEAVGDNADLELVQVINSQVTCQGKTVDLALTCDSANNPTCVQH